MATLEYCSNLALELERWSKKLHAISKKIDHLPSIEKYKLTAHLEGMHILITEMDDRIMQLRNECPSVAEPEKEERGIKTGERTKMVLTEEEKEKLKKWQK